MNTNIYRIIILGLVTILSACETTGGSGSLSGDDAGESGNQAGGQSGAESKGLQSGPGYSASALDDPQSPLSKRVIYFMYDSAEIKPEFIPVVEAHARYLASHPQIQVAVEGHADERGSREYNIALGEQRAYSIARKLGIQGAGDSQLRIVSYGEEKPVSYGHDEAAWQLNRRVEIIYPGY